MRTRREDIAPKVAADKAYQNAQENTQVYRQFVENELFRHSVRDLVAQLTSSQGWACDAARRSKGGPQDDRQT
jgi:hypothetical protein